MKVVADSHALVWYGHDSSKLSSRASAVLDDATATDGIVVSVATLVDLWYVTQTTGSPIHDSGLVETIW
jgi:PIN domain nuclease of toxin-antitoxin system